VYSERENWIYEAIISMVEMIQAAENYGKRPGAEKRAEVIVKFRKLCDSMPRDFVPAILKSDVNVGMIIDGITRVINFIIGKVSAPNIPAPEKPISRKKK